MHAKLSLQDSARWGCVAGSIMAEWQGVPPAEVCQLVHTAHMRYQLLLDLEQAGIAVGSARPAARQTAGADSSSSKSDSSRSNVVAHALGLQRGQKGQQHGLFHGYKHSAAGPALLRHAACRYKMYVSSTITPARSGLLVR
jgi:hypothetical protein